jgi:selenocysteine-specific elongation factor
MIVGTAGHIDHGKTTLVRALTGVDTDRLKEEKARGISIELGYAYAPLSGGEVLGFIDVPGHERLIHTMVAGACGIDFALLVVAADDGPMPQTHEHLAILALLGIERGAVALSKSDRVASTRLATVGQEIAQALSGTPLAGAPIFPLDATHDDDPGVAALRAHLEQQAACVQRPEDELLFRLSVDRVFSLPGHGTVVTGTVFSGEVRTGDTLAVMPAGRTARVRTLHAQNRLAERGRRGERCALNLAGIERSAIARGDWIAEPSLLTATRRIDAQLRLLPQRQLQLRPWTPVHLHLGTMHTVAHLVPLETPGAETGSPHGALHVQLVFDSDVCALPGDRFILRDAQALHTVGGGVVLDPSAPARRRRTPERSRYRAALARLIAGEGVEPLLEHSPFGARISDLVRLTGLAPASIRLPAGAVIVQAGQEQHVLSAAQWSALRERALEALADFHTRLPEEPGPDLARLRRIAAPGIDAALWRALVEELVGEQAIVRSAPWLRLPGHSAAMSAQDVALAHSLQPLLVAGGFDPPWVRTLASSVQEPEERVREVLRRLLRQGSVYQVVPDLFYDAGRVADLAEIAARLAREHGAVSAARYRDALGTGRKRAIQILEFFDRVGYTRRVRESHVLRRESWRMA